MANEVESSAPAPVDKIVQAAPVIPAARNEEPDKAASRLAELEKTAAAANERLGKLDESLKHAIASYRALVIKANPDILPDLITGETIADVDSALNRSRELIEKVKAGLEVQKVAARIPAGAPQRGPADTTGMSAREKINLGVEKARGK